jgi:serine/threonine protein kinase
MNHEEKVTLASSERQNSGAIASTLVSGTLIVGQYEVIQTLGAGGMGCVYKCLDQATNRVVAIKLLPADRTGDSSSTQRFQREAQAIAKLEHPNLVRLLSFSTIDDGTPYLIMEYVDGVSLEQILKEKGTLSNARAIRIASLICDALGYAHSQGVIHRDLKPSNIIVQRLDDGSESIKIVDFGIAKVLGTDLPSTTGTGEIFGSPTYMSPEQAQGKGVTERTDQYSLGCLLFEALTGVPPFVADSAINVLVQHLQTEAPTLKEASLGKCMAPLEVENCVARLLKKDPNRRYASMAAVKEALTDNTGAQKSASTADSNLGSTNNSNRFIIAILVALVTGLCIFTGWSIISSIGTGQSDAPRKAAAPPDQSPLLPTRENMTDDLWLDRQIKSNPQVQFLSIKEKRFSPNGLQPLSRARSLKGLDFNECWGFDDQSLEYVSRLPLTHLTFIRTEVSSNALELFAKIPTLEFLGLDGSIKLDDQSIKTIASFHRLNTLCLNNHSELTPGELAELAKLKQLKRLYLDNGKAGGHQKEVRSGISALVNLPLTTLSLRYADVTNDDIDTLIQMRDLKWLNLTGSEITDAGLLKLAKLPNLTTLIVPHCNHITANGLEKFKQVNKKCTVQNVLPEEQKRLKNNEEVIKEFQSS